MMQIDNVPEYGCNALLHCHWDVEGVFLLCPADVAGDEKVRDMECGEIACSSNGHSAFSPKLKARESELMASVIQRVSDPQSEQLVIWLRVLWEIEMTDCSSSFERIGISYLVQNVVA